MDLPVPVEQNHENLPTHWEITAQVEITGARVETRAGLRVVSLTARLETLRGPKECPVRSHRYTPS